MAAQKLTYSATNLIVRQLELAGFKLLTPLETLGPTRRTIIVTNEIYDTLRVTKTFLVRAEAELFVSIFSAGLMVLVSDRRDARVDMKPVEGSDYVWSMAFRKPRPGGRMLGIFAARDVFVGLGLHYRDELGGTKFDEAAQQAQELWDARMVGMTRVRSWLHSDVLGGLVRNLDDKDENE